MRYAGIIKDDTAAAPGISLSLYTQGCNLKCPGCHNYSLWDFSGGYEYTTETKERILEALNANNILRPLCILGGEPLSYCNLPSLVELCKAAKKKYPEIDIYIWTGFTKEELDERVYHYKEAFLPEILKLVDVLITGRYEEDKRDIMLELRGSSNQKIYKFVTEENDNKQFGFERPNGFYYYIIRKK